ncbi:hypothetical protein QR680_010706 [Steinernema hermaphroditum]|uniref:Uncharacterized protein n=1 Tax=Steinernema hermaphroditum TaxID=289476 RepID=A0AA39IPW0_9BILA|nr:hypothetical protein QR680_010706 [Steinernema hermaphroditum]
MCVAKFVILPFYYRNVTKPEPGNLSLNCSYECRTVCGPQKRLFEIEKSKIKKEIDRFKQSLKVAEAAYAVKVEAFLKARPTDCGQQKRTEEKQDSQSGTTSQH